MIGTEQVWLIADMIGLVALGGLIALVPRRKPAGQFKADEKRIHSMLDDAMNNDYDISTWTADDIVADLLAFGCLEERDTAETLKVYVITWKMKRNETF